MKTETCIGNRYKDFTPISVQGQSHSIASPGYPGYYPADVDCVWKVLARPEHVIVTFIEDIDLRKTKDVLVIGKLAKLTP